MTPLEILVMSLGFPFLIVEISQLYQLVRSQRRLTSIWETILEDPEYAGDVASNFVFGFVKNISEDPEKEKAFYAMIQVMAAHATASIKQQWSQAVKKKAPKNIFEALQSLTELPAVQQKIEQKISGMIGNPIADPAQPAEQSGSWGK